MDNISTTTRTILISVAGGTASVLGGGKFANGALSSAFIFMFNEMREFIKAPNQEELRTRAIVKIMERSQRRFNIRGYGHVYSYEEAKQVYLNRIASGRAYTKALLTVASVVPVVRGGRVVYYFVMRNPEIVATGIDYLDGAYGGTAPLSNASMAGVLAKKIVDTVGQNE